MELSREQSINSVEVEPPTPDIKGKMDPKAFLELLESMDFPVNDDIPTTIKEKFKRTINYSYMTNTLFGIEQISIKVVGYQELFHKRVIRKNEVTNAWFGDKFLLTLGEPRIDDIPLLPTHDPTQGSIFERGSSLNMNLWENAHKYHHFVRGDVVHQFDIDVTLPCLKNRIWYPDANVFHNIGFDIIIDGKIFTAVTACQSLVINEDQELIDNTADRLVRMCLDSTSEISIKACEEICQFCFITARIDMSALINVNWDRISDVSHFAFHKNRLLVFVGAAILRYGERVRTMSYILQSLEMADGFLHEEVSPSIRNEIRLYLDCINWLETVMTKMNSSIDSAYHIVLENVGQVDHRYCLAHNLVFLCGTDSIHS